MAAPTVTARSTPAGIFLKEGYRILVAFAADPDISVWEKTVQPAGIDTGDSIDNVTQHAVRYRIQRARALVTMTPMQLVCAYDPVAYTQLLAIAGAEGAITNHFPDGSTVSFYGYLQKVDPSSHEEGKQPEMTLTVVPTNYDPVNKVEAGPLVVEVAGT